ncbi:MAG TPA: hypothetical protein VF541_20895, partial [Longimicrobium sp.]
MRIGPAPLTCIASLAAAMLILRPSPAITQATPGAANHSERPRVAAQPRTEPIVLDGVLGEAVWASAPAAADFRQFEPREGRPATQRTEVRFAYDEHALYVGAR